MCTVVIVQGPCWH